MTTKESSATGRETSASPPRRAPVSFRTWRWIAFAAQAVVILGLPFVRIGGESALRLDIPGGKLHAFGLSYAVDEAFVVLAATLFLTAAFLLVTVLFGRVWCGWSCPQTVLGDLTSLVEQDPRGRRRPWRRAAGFALTALVSAIAGANLVWYFVPPQKFLARLAAGRLGPEVGWSWAVTAGVLFLDLAFLRQTFCATICPYAKVQGVLFDRHTLVVAYDERRDADCIDCLACVRVCPTRIDIRDGLQMECIACAACVDACEPIMRKLGRAPDLVGYFHGEPGGRRRWLRPATLALGAMTVAALALLGGAVADRPLVAVTVSSDAATSPRRAADGRIVNAFVLVLENRARFGVEVALSLQATGASETTLRPDRVPLAPGELRRLRLVASARGLEGAGAIPATLTAAVSGAADSAAGAPAARSFTPLSLVVPEKP
jgi:cytochrome c oxidase accessory protein FixG